MKWHKNAQVLERVLGLLLMSVIFLGMSSAAAAPILSITPITWNVIGLDSNNVNVGPNRFPVGARVCNVGDTAATNVTANIFLDGGTTNPRISILGATSLSTASLSAGPIPTTTQYQELNAPSNCSDFYFLVDIARNSDAYSSRVSDTASPAARKTQLYHIEATASTLGTVSTPLDRELYVEKLISQARNNITQFSGPTQVLVGGTYTYTLDATTAPGGYEQLNVFTNFPNTIFQITKVSTTYTSPSGAQNSTVYADACGWENNRTSTSYHNNLTCIGPINYGSGKAGDTIKTLITVKILSTGTATVQSVINDFSGSSYHYNADYGDAINSVTITASNPVSGADLLISKTHTAFSVGSSGTYQLTVSNGGTGATSGLVTVSDTLPSGLNPTAAIGTGWSCTVMAATNSVLGMVSCTRSDVLVAGNSYPPIIITAAVTANKPATVTNTATVAGGNDQNINNNSASDPTIITAAVNLGITKVQSSPPAGTSVVAGASVTYTLTVTNPQQNSVDAPGAIVADPAVNGFTVTGVTCSASNGAACPNPPISVSAFQDGVAIPTFGNGSSLTFTVTGTATAAANGTITNTATVNAPSGFSDTNPSNNIATATTTVIAPRIGVAKTRSAVTANGDGTYSVTYTLLVRNYSNPSAALSSVQITDSLSAFGTYTATNPPATAGQYTLSSAPVVSGATNSASLSADSSYNGSSNTNLLVSASSSLPNGGVANANRSSALIAFTVKFRPITTSSLTVNNTATASAAGGVSDVSDTQITVTTPATAGVVSSLEPDPNGDGNPSTAGEARPTPFVLTFAPTLKITKSHVGNFVVGDSGSYTLTVTNTGTANTTGTLEIKDLLPANMVLGSISTSSGSLSAPTTASGVTTLTLTPAAGGIAPGGTVTLTVNFSLPITEAANGSSFIVYDQFPNATNYASVGGGGDTVTAAPAPGAGCADANHCASDPTTVKPKDIPSPQVCTARGGTRGSNLLTEGTFGTSSSTTLPTFGPALGVLPGDVVGPSTIYTYIDLGTGVNAVAAAAGNGNNGPGSPEDGEYTIVNSSRARSGSAWYHVLDHTTATPSGRFMMINAADTTTGGVFYQKQVTVTPNTNYDFSFWMMNVIANNSSLLPNIQLEFEFNDGRVEVVGTGSIPNTDKPLWREYAAVINSVNATRMTVRFKNLAIGGGGNDLALDDLSFTPCTFSSTTSISGTVFVDSNADGSIGGTETGRIPGVRVELVDQNNNNALIAIVLTDASGNYQFQNIPTGRNYTVRVDTTDPDLAGYSVTLPNPPSINLGTVSSTQTDKNFGFRKVNELAVSKVAQNATTPFGPITVRNDGQSFRYLLTVQNQGSANQTGVQVSDALPSGVVLDTAVTPNPKFIGGTTPSYNSVSGLWTVGALASGATATLELYVKLSSGGSQSVITNTATLQNPPVGDSAANNTAIATLLPNPIKLTKTVQKVLPTPAGTVGTSVNAKPGDTLEYCVTASSTLAAARDFNLSDPIFPNQTFVAGSITGVSNGAVAAATAGNVGTVTGTLTGVSSSASKTMCFRTTVN